MQRIGDRADRRRMRRAGVAGRQNDQSSRTLRNRYPDRRVRGDRAIGQIEILVADRRKGAGDRGRCDDRLRCGTFREHHAVARNNIRRDNVNRELGILQIAIGQIVIEQFSNPVMWNQEIAAPEKSQQRSPCDWKNIVPLPTPARSSLAAERLLAWDRQRNKRRSRPRRWSQPPCPAICRGQPANASCRPESRQSCRRRRTQTPFWPIRLDQISGKSCSLPLRRARKNRVMPGRL